MSNCVGPAQQNQLLCTSKQRCLPSQQIPQRKEAQALTFLDLHVNAASSETNACYTRSTAGTAHLFQQLKAGVDCGELAGEFQMQQWYEFEGITRRFRNALPTINFTRISQRWSLYKFEPSLCRAISEPPGFSARIARQVTVACNCGAVSRCFTYIGEHKSELIIYVGIWCAPLQGRTKRFSSSFSADW